MRSRIMRRWRSVSFRSGLLAALSVGIVASAAAFALTNFVFALFAFAGDTTQTGLMDRAEDQLTLGVAPEDVNLPPLSVLTPDQNSPETDRAFWVILDDDGIASYNGDVNQAVLEADLRERQSGINVELPANDIVGVKRADGDDWSYTERSVSLADGSTVRIITADDGIYSFGNFLRQSLYVSVPVILVLMGVAMAVTSLLIRRALRRVERMRAEVEMITEQSLNRRVPTADAADGIDKLGHTMNDMLERLESSTAQQKQFLADASHELRSPVAGLLAQLDVAAAYPDRVDTVTLLPKLRNEAKRLQVLVADLLYLGRSDAVAVEAAPYVSATKTEVSIDALIATEVEHQAHIPHEIRLAAEARSGAVVQGVSADLTRALRNLVDNALRHADNEVRLSTMADSETVSILVADDGPGISPSDQERIFDRFVRLDEARARDAGGSGLGLAIAREIAVAHGGSIDLAESANPGATFRLTLPLDAIKD